MVLRHKINSYGVWELGEIEAKPAKDVSVNVPGYTCTQNKKHKMQMTQGEEDLFPPPLSPLNLRFFCELLWDVCDGLTVPSPAIIARKLGMQRENVTPYLNRVLHYIAAAQEEDNDKK